MEFSRKKEARTMIISGLVPVVLIALGYYFFTANGACFPMAFFMVGEWFGVFITVLIIGGYGVFVGWIGFKDFSSTKKLSARAVILTIIGLLGICAVLLPVCD